MGPPRGGDHHSDRRLAPDSSTAMDEFLAKLGQRMAGLEHQHAPTGFAVAFSGGLDSTVLLTGCKRLDLALPLRALNIDHGLHPDSARWSQHCADVAAALGVGFASARVSIDTSASRSVEALAREKRYRALAAMLEPGEMLLTAHHDDDQLETVLLRLFRGAGVRGLRGVLESAALERGLVGRPLLGFNRSELLAIANAWQLQWIEDPSNRDPRFDRNYVRHAIVPAIEARWPAVASTVAQTAARLVDAERSLEDLAAIDAAGLDEPSRVPLESLSALEPHRQRNLLRFLLIRCALPLPSARQLEELVAALTVTRRDAQVRVHWPGAEARVYGGKLYLMAELPQASLPDARGAIGPDAPWVGPEGRLELEAVSAGQEALAIPDQWIRGGLSVRFRAGGERLRPSGDAHHRELKKLLQEAHIVPWMRSRIPLLYHDGELVAVGDLWVADARGIETGAERAWRVRWTEHPALY